MIIPWISLKFKLGNGSCDENCIRGEKGAACLLEKKGEDEAGCNPKR